MKTILLVEDDTAIRETYAQVLTDEGYRIEEAENGAVALRLLEAMPELPCLVLLDMMMPEMSGKELLKLLRGSHHLAALPVVVISAGEVSRADITGARRFVKKPVSLAALLAVVKEFCGTTT